MYVNEYNITRHLKDIYLYRSQISDQLPTGERLHAKVLFLHQNLAT